MGAMEDFKSIKINSSLDCSFSEFFLLFNCFFQSLQSTIWFLNNEYSIMICYSANRSTLKQIFKLRHHFERFLITGFVIPFTHQ